MASGPAPTTEFEAWGQAIWRLVPPEGTPITQVNRPRGTIVLFAISDVRRQWLGWYYYNTPETVDAGIMGYPYQVYGENAAQPSRFTTSKAITVEELVAPVLASRGGGPKASQLTRARADIAPSSSKSTLTVAVRIAALEQREGRPLPILLHIDQPVFKGRDPDVIADRFGGGWLTFVMSEPFSYPVQHLNVRKRLKSMAKRIMS